MSESNYCMYVYIYVCLSPLIKLVTLYISLPLPLFGAVFRPLSFQMDNEVKACGALCLLLVCHDV